MADILIPMLADRISAKVGGKRIQDDQWWAEQKFDGNRVMIHIENGKVTALNRRGEECKFNVLVAKDFAHQFTTGLWVFDGELVSNTYWVFDLPRAGTTLTPDTPWSLRREVLERFFAVWTPPERIKLARTARTAEEKQEMLDRLAAGGAEGIMLKKVNGIYRPGKRSEVWAKFKFWKSCDVVVLETCIDGKSNARMGLIDPTQDGSKAIRDVGTVSTLGKWSTLVEPGSVLEVKYLYAVDRNEPKLYQPNILKVRDDKRAVECHIDQLEFTDKDFRA